LLLPVLALSCALPLAAGSEPVTAAAGRPPAGAALARDDPRSDPLPPGALLRIGTTRLRHGAWVYSAAFSPDGTMLVSGGDDHTVCLWDAATGREIWRYRGQERSVYAVAFSPDGRRVASGSADSTVHVLEAATGTAVLRLQGSGNRVTAVAFSPDGKVLVSGTGYEGNCTVSSWDAATGKELRRLTDGEGTDYRVAFAPDGKTLASSRKDRTRLWDIVTGRVLRDIPCKEETWCLAFSPDGKTLATGNADSLLHLWDPATGKELGQLRGHESPRYSGGVHGVAFGPDGKTLFSGGGDQTIRLWDVTTGQPVRRSDKDTSRIAFVALSPDGRTVASGSSGNRVRLWDVATGKQTRLFAGHQDALESLVFSPDGGKLITGGADGTARVWEARTGREHHRFEDKDRWAAALAVSPDGKTLAYGGPGRAIRLRDLTTGQEVRRLGGDDPQFFGRVLTGTLAFSPDGRVLAACDDHDLLLWDVAAGQLLRRLDVNGSPTVVLFSADGKTLAALEGGPATCEWRIHLRDAATGRSVRHFGSGAPPHIDTLMPWVHGLAFSPDFRLVATVGPPLPAGDPQPVRLWDVSTGKELFALEGPEEEFTAVAFSPDGKLVAAGTAGGVVFLWEVSTGKVRRRLPGHQGRIRALAFAPDGTTLASGSADSTALVWGLIRPLREGGAGSAPRSAADLERLWTDLAGIDAGKADDAIRDLLTTAAEAVAFLKERLHPVPPAARKRVLRLVRQLDSDQFPERESAARELEQVRDLAEAALRQALAARPTPEVRRRAEQFLGEGDRRRLSPDLLRAVRAVEVLEHLNTPESREVLETLAEGIAEARLTQEAKAALGRLVRRPGGSP
jgi:WD40 repeat protein